MSSTGARVSTTVAESRFEHEFHPVSLSLEREAVQQVEDIIRDRFDIPDFIDLAHHNAIAGRDRWKDVDHLVVVGRTQPPPQAVANIAGALRLRLAAILVRGCPGASTVSDAFWTLVLGERA